MDDSMEQGYRGSGYLNEGMDFWKMGLDENKGDLLKEIEEHESEVEEIEKRTPPINKRC
jgi:hypothetical protein